MSKKIETKWAYGTYVKLKKVWGKPLFKGICPFEENVRSETFMVDEKLGFYHCFGCGRGGDIQNFLLRLSKKPEHRRAQL